MSLRNTLQTLQHRLIETGLATDVLDGAPTLRASGASAQFAAADWREWYRAHNAMGETEPLRWLLNRVREDDVVWDVGAAVGTYSCLAADLGARVVAVEPHPGAAERLRENVRLNGQTDCVSVHECALGAQSGRARLRETGGPANGSHHLGEGALAVVVRRGDELACPDPDVLKVDVEGHERAALAGLSERLAGVRVALVEVHGGVSTAAVREQLAGAGFAVERIGDRSDEVHLGAENTDNSESES